MLEEPEQEKKVEEPNPEPKTPPPQAYPPYNSEDRDIHNDQNEYNNNELEDYYDDFSPPVAPEEKKKEGVNPQDMPRPGNFPRPIQQSYPPQNFRDLMDQRPEGLKAPPTEAEPSRTPIDDSQSMDAGEDAPVPGSDFPGISEPEKPKQEPDKKPEEANPEKPNLLQKVKNTFDLYELLKCRFSLQEIEINFDAPANEFSTNAPSKPKSPFSKGFC